MALYRIGTRQPTVDPTAFIAPEATLVGDVQVGPRANIWFGAVARGDNEPIKIGAGTNVQEGAVLHADPGFPLVLHDNVTVGHQAMVHGCTVEEGALIGIQAIVMNGAVIGAGSLVGAGSVVTEGKVFPPRSLIIGSPAKVVRELTEEQVAGIRRIADNYALRGGQYAADMEKVG